MADLRGDDLRAEIARQARQVADLRDEWTRAQRRLEALQAQLRDDGDVASVVAPSSNDEKVALFRSLFRGRADIFPRWWRNSKKGTTGYAPACANEWVRGVCQKPRVKCGVCPHQAFVPVTDQGLRDHLRGRHVMGVYPLLPDDTCWFLAVDFDKGDWHRDVLALVEVAREVGLAPAVERSRSGEGGHVWLFFSAPVLAATARRMGSALLTAAMARRPELSMDSYDRLFPNQDTLPKGGFGNLIALPLQFEARQRGNAVFVDDEGQPLADQWAFLAHVQKADPGQVEAVAERMTVRDAEGLAAPAKVKLAEPLPRRVRVRLAEQLAIDRTDLPPALVDRIRRLAVFANSEFHRKQAMRLSTARTPRVITCAEDLPGAIGLPRGCLADLAALLREHSIELAVEDERTSGQALEVAFDGELTDLQQAAVEALMAHETGVMVAPPGTGKTVAGTFLVAARGRSTLVLVHRTQLLEQWRAQLALFLGVPSSEIGQVGGGRNKVTGRLDVAMIQSLARRKDDGGLAQYGHVVVDECHHVPAVSFERVMKRVRARYVTGLTATPQRRDGHDPILTYQLGPVRHAVDGRSRVAQRAFEHHLVVRETTFKLTGADEAPGIQSIYRQLGEDRQRNDMILDDVISAVAEGRAPLLLTERRDHLEWLAERLRGFTRHLVILRGGMGVKQRRQATEELASIPEKDERLVLATGRFIGEGFDDARLDTLFLCMPVSWKGTLVQYAGRLHRSHRAKREVRIIDYVDGRVPMLARMFEKRKKGYRAMGYELSG